MAHRPREAATVPGLYPSLLVKLVRRLVQAVVVTAMVVVPAACGSPIYVASCQKKLVSSSAGPITDANLTEISGIHVGVRNPSTWWVHNDSGDSARVFALDATGTTRGTYTFGGAAAVDWEDMTVVPGPAPGSGTIYAADIGDNPGTRTEIQLYRVDEPVVPASGTAPTDTLTGVETLHLTYPDGPHDAETFMIDPVTNDVIVVTKLLTGGTVGVYRAAGPLTAGSTTQLTRVADLAYPTGLANAVTGGDVSADGLTVAIRSYGAIRVYTRAKSKALWTALAAPGCAATVPAEVQGEAIGFNATGSSFTTVSEGASQFLHSASVASS